MKYIRFWYIYHEFNLITVKHHKNKTQSTGRKRRTDVDQMNHAVVNINVVTTRTDVWETNYAL